MAFLTTFVGLLSETRMLLLSELRGEKELVSQCDSCVKEKSLSSQGTVEKESSQHVNHRFSIIAAQLFFNEGRKILFLSRISQDIE